MQLGMKISADTTIYQHASADVQTITFSVSQSTSEVEGVEEYTDDSNQYASIVAVGDSLAAWQIPSEDNIDSKVIEGWNSAAGTAPVADGLTAEEIDLITPVVGGVSPY